MPEFVEKFPLKVTGEQEKVLFCWLETCRKAWNIGLDALLELDRNTSRVRVGNPATGKVEVLAVPSCRLATRGEFESDLTPPAPTANYKNKLKGKDGKEEEVWAECCWILPKGRKGGTVHVRTGEPTHEIAPDLIRVGQCCPLRLPWAEPKLGLQVPGKLTMKYFLTQTNVRALYPEFADEFEQVPSWFIRGVADSLWVAWSKYKSGSGGEPKFKGAADKISSLAYADASKLKLELLEAPPKKPGQQPTTRDGTIAIPKLDRNAKGKQVAGLLEVRDLGRRFTTVEEEGNRVFRPLSVARIVRTPSATWQLHLTSFEISRGEIYDLCRLKMFLGTESLAFSLAPLARLHLLTLSPWTLKRRKDCALTVPGEGYVVAVDDRGYGYSVLPRRPTDGALDPHNIVARLDRQIEELQKQISWKVECSRQHGTPRNSNRLQQLRQRKRKLEAQRAAILRSSRQKIVYFISERSRRLSVTSKPAQRVRKPKAKLKPGELGEFEPNGAEIVAAINRVAATSAPGEFVALLKRNAQDRGQVLKLIEEKKEEKKPKKGKAKNQSTKSTPKK